MKKLLISIAAVVAMVLPAGTGSEVAATSYPWGDLNCSGAVTSVEISAIVQMAAGAPDPWPSCPMPADLNCSGAITSLDIAIMIHIAAGGAYTPPASCG